MFVNTCLGISNLTRNEYSVHVELDKFHPTARSRQMTKNSNMTNAVMDSIFNTLL